MVDGRDNEEEQTGTGSPRSADGSVRSPSVTGPEEPDLTINRSGGGGSGGPSTEEDDSEGSGPESMDELLGE